MRATLFGLALSPAFTISLAVAQQTLLVGPGQTYTSIQPAIAAAFPGDTVLVLAGTYSGPLDIDKGIQLIGQGAQISGPAGLLAPPFASVHDLPAAQYFTMAGFRAVGGSLSIPEGMSIVLRDCAGPVVLRDLPSSGGFRRFVVEALRCPQVFVGDLDGFGINAADSTILCERSFVESSGITLRGLNSTLVLVHCTIRSTSSPLSLPTWLEGGRLVASRCQFIAGATLPRSAIYATNTELLLDPSTVLQPSGGAPAIQGGTAVSFPIASIAAELVPGQLTIISHGPANEPFATMLAPADQLQLTPLGLTWLDPARLSLLAFASYGPDRLQTLTLPLPPLPPGLVAGLQSVGFSPSGISLGVPSLVVTR